ncbi:hypothetical protein QCA50_013547 [Cerrena zonata]|uniref:Uncharacterized protein n=1 Tax=Cerrena zonata TaxID=2478898 RepID=A0AAW0FWL0_9APHY
MSTPPRFQVIQQTATSLSSTLRGLQARASPYGGPVATYYAAYCDLMTKLHDIVLPSACETSNFLVSNIFGELLRQGATSTEKKDAIDRFRNNLSRKISPVRNLQQEMEQLCNGLNHGALQSFQGNPNAIANQFETIIGAIRSINMFYDRIQLFCSQFRAKIDQGASITAEIQQETRWLAAVAADYRMFNPTL